MNYALILAGGVGSRFWPLSRQEHPKQFLNLCSDKPMLVDTIRRISGLIKKENIYIATGKIYQKNIGKCLGKADIPQSNFFFEPEGKNTLAPIGLLSQRINKISPEAVIIVLPSDHFVKDKKKFLGSLKEAVASARGGFIVTFGIRPKRPDTGYGYIKVSSQAYRVERFIEKPNLEKAKQFIKDKRYFWNSGIFIFRADVILDEIKKFMPYAYRIIMKMNRDKDTVKLWKKMPAISIDYGIMEKSKKIVLLPLDCGWNDCGNWQALHEIMAKDGCQNVLRGNCAYLDTKNTFIWGGRRFIAAIGLDDLIIVDTDDALLVCAKDRAQDVKKIIRHCERTK